MKLLNKYQSRVFQFALEIIARLEACKQLEQKDINDLALRRGLEYGGQVVEPLAAAGILTRQGTSWKLKDGYSYLHLPMSKMEKDFLAMALLRPEAEMFLDAETRKILGEFCGSAAYMQAIQQYAPMGEPIPQQPKPEEFRTILEAIHTNRLLQYHYRVKGDKTVKTSITLPWKIEYSAFDHRWWVILYDPQQEKTIKAQLGNLFDLQLAGDSYVSRDEIEKAMDTLLEPEPVVLEIQKTKGAVERTFLAFENQLFEETKQLDDNRFHMVFRYYRFDRSEIVRKLLYLGPAVTLLSPVSLQKELCEMLDSALMMYSLSK